MAQGRNPTGGAPDGSLLFVLGGRTGANVVANGFDTVQVYDPVADAWTSTESGSGLAPLPGARGGMGKAVFWGGEFYILGGETLNGSLATPPNVYNRVDIYNPTTNTWRLGPVLPTGRHGIFPLFQSGRIYVAAGGVQAGGSQSAVLAVFNLATLAAPVPAPGPAPTAGSGPRNLAPTARRPPPPPEPLTQTHADVLPLWHA